MKIIYEKLLLIFLILSLGLVPMQSAFAHIMIDSDNSSDMHAMHNNTDAPASDKMLQMDTECDGCSDFKSCNSNDCVMVNGASVAMMSSFSLPSVQDFDTTASMYSPSNYLNQIPDSLLRPPKI